MKYLGIQIDKRFSFKNNIDLITEKCSKLIFALSKSAKINWGLKYDVMKIIYEGAILPVLSYGAPMWMDSVCKGNSATKLTRVHRLIALKAAKAYRTTSYEALCILTGMTPIITELRKAVQYYHIMRGQDPTIDPDVPKTYRTWSHPADGIDTEGKVENMPYTIEMEVRATMGLDQASLYWKITNSFTNFSTSST